MKIYGSTQYIENPEVGDLKLKVNSMWDFGGRDICFQTIESTFGGGTTIISYDVEECTEVREGIIVGGTRKVKNTKWRQAEVNQEILEELQNRGYTIANNILTNPLPKLTSETI